ncbi:MAG: hypothetical protein CH6_2541 [Candidatus Kapaibacterium sp.]|nr:MAG: hypothetical protein CH6_2541 [Candidatus Kapabacteria bacterium]
MKKYQLLGGGIIEGETPEEIIETLRRMSFNPGRVRQEFMDETAKACYVYSGAIINTDHPKNFVEDLIKYGFLNELKQ